ncbi:LysM peptidoglycan-binding domain-containing protein [Candidatus Saccharibacteria bacterium]|nr:LysM peptidoglycan-binding domain-containing protein [Candidatus Saccharibacteria bacterium]
MRTTILRVALLVLVLFSGTIGHVGAATLPKQEAIDNPINFSISTPQDSEKSTKKVAQTAKDEESQKVETPPVPTPPAPVVYTVIPGDTLTKIASAHQTTWQRLYAKNIQISNPDTINSGDIITIPYTTEQIAERALPLPPVIPQQTTRIRTTNASAVSAAPRAPTSSAGNTYSPGYCTWYAKNRRPDLPNRLGNAGAWVSSAAAQGFATGSAPRAGAIGQQGNHVVYVEGVNGDGTVTVSEMNYSGLYVVSSRTVPAGTFTYIY